jgi:hypothetical protein|nr:MAG TPA: hypothetical protein [Caudoviricetes sp.]
MRIINYRIFKPVHVKTEVTKLTSLPITNSTDSYYLVTPIIINDLPNDVVFLSESILIAPNSTYNYIPKLVKVGANLNSSFTTILPKGIEIKVVVIDSLGSESLTITSTESYKASGKGDNLTVTPMLPTDGAIIAKELEEEAMGTSETNKLLDIIDSKAINEDFSDEEQVNVTHTITHREEVLQPLITNDKPKKRRGRPKGSKNKVPGQLEMKQLLTANDEETNYNNVIDEEEEV